jgi:hypothetical protein
LLQQKQQQIIDPDWGNKHQLDILIENIIAWLSIEEGYKDSM